MSTSNENEEHTLCGGSMLRKLKLKDIWEVSHKSLPAWLMFAPCTASWFAHTNSVQKKKCPDEEIITARVSPCLGSLIGAGKYLW